MIYHKAIFADQLTPVSAFLRISEGVERAFLLESVEGGEKIGRYSFIGINPEKRFEGKFSDFRKSFPRDNPSDPNLPPFTGGAVGVFCYDMVRELEQLPDLNGWAESQSHTGMSSVNMDFYSTILAFDHVSQQIVIMSHRSQQEVDDLEARLRDGINKVDVSSALGKISLVPVPDLSAFSDFSSRVDSNFSTGEFEIAVEKAKEYIRAGDIFQVVLSQRFSVDFNGNPFDVYRALRFVNPSPYMFFLKLGKTCVIGSSPEMLVRVQGGELEYRPIAGTRRRGRDPVEEKHLEQELLNDEKERAEHLMLVDLGRNDLGRVSQYSSVQVEDLMFLEKYSHVMHLVSSLKGKLRPELDRFDALAACFPAGTVSGAPKVRAMEIIDELEPHFRGIYAGAIGYLDYSGNLDSCITIRTIVLQNGKAYLQAGAGIVADSVPELENKECFNKAMALLRSLELAKILTSDS